MRVNQEKMKLFNIKASIDMKQKTIFMVNLLRKTYRTRLGFGLSVLFIMAFLLGSVQGWGQSPYTSTGSGNWNSDATWSGSGVPGAGDIVNIAGGHTITVTANAAAGSITFTGASATLSVSSTFTLTVSNAVTLNNAAGTSNAATISGGGTLSCSSLTVGGTTTGLSNDRTTTLVSRISNLTISGNLNLNGEDDNNDENDALFNLPMIKHCFLVF